MNNFRLLYIVVLFIISCSNKEQEIIILKSEQFKELDNFPVQSIEAFNVYSQSGNAIFYYDIENNQVVELSYNNEKNFDDIKTYPIANSIDKEQPVQYSLMQDKFLLISYPDSLICYDYKTNLSLAKITHLGYENELKNFPYLLNLNCKSSLVNNMLYLENYNDHCENYPMDCEPYDALWSFDLETQELKQIPVKFHDKFYNIYLKYQNEVNSTWSNDTMFYVSSTHNTIEAICIKNESKYTAPILNLTSKIISPSTEDDYMTYLMNSVSFGHQFTNLQYNSQTQNLYLVYLPEIPIYNDEGLLNYTSERDKFLMVFNKNLTLLSQNKLPSILSSKFIALNDGMVFFESKKGIIEKALFLSYPE